MAQDEEAFANIDIGVLGKTMLDAARAADIGVTITLVNPLRHIYISDAAAEILGWPAEELLGKPPLSHTPPQEMARMKERLARRAGGELGQARYEVTSLRRDGTPVEIEVAATDVMISGQRAVLSFVVDISARKAMERERLHAETRFRALIESAPEAIGISRVGHFVYANPACLSILGFADAQALYATPLASLLDAENDAIRQAREATILERGVRLPPQTYRVRRRDGSVLLLEISSVCVDYEGQPSVLSIARDITARKRLETQLIQADRLAALGTLAAGVAHEINNPLAYMMLNLEWISRKLPAAVPEPANSDSLLTMVEEVRSGAQRVSTIVRELRSFSRVDGDTRRTVDLAEVVDAAIRITGHEIRHRARLVKSFQPVRPVWGNQARLEQVVINLLMNAGQAVSETSSETNEIQVIVREDGMGRAVLEVSDNGKGISAEVQSRIFDPFFTTKPVGVGTGLGLSICHGIVTSLGGQIRVDSEPNVGTTFRVVLPTTDLREDDSAAATSRPPDSNAPRRAHILVVDDEAPIANAMREMLGCAHEVVVATSGREALAVIRSGAQFDVIFCDLMMPGMSGIDLYEQLRSQSPGLERKLVFMTGGAFTTRAAEFLACIDNRRIDKPFSLGMLERIVHEMAAPSAAG